MVVGFGVSKKKSSRTRGRLAFLTVLFSSQIWSQSAERRESFDADPLWDGHNNRTAVPEARRIRQDFGYSMTSHFGGAPGEFGGFITAAAEPAYYAKQIAQRSLGDFLTASGKIMCLDKRFHVLVGFFNTNTINEWRTPNTIALRLQGRGDIFYAYVEYATSRWRAGGDSPGGFPLVHDPATGRSRFKGFPTGTNVHDWSLSYDPAGNNGAGSVTAVIDGEKSICHLDPAHRSDGATFNRFGLINVMKSADDGGELWFDNVSINGVMEMFAHDPHWDEFHNRRSYTTRLVRPWFDFGYSPTHFAGGRAAGEMGGLVFRGDGRYTNLMAFYGAPLAELTLHKPLSASGKIALCRGVSDSDVLFGFFHSDHSLNSAGSDAIAMPPDFLGVSIGGPSREGFMFVPAYRLHEKEQNGAPHGPYILPDGVPHDWTLVYSPAVNGESRMIVTLDGKGVSLPVPNKNQAMDAHFNRFGLISTHTDGNSQLIYFDDVTYTVSQ